MSSFNLPHTVTCFSAGLKKLGGCGRSSWMITAGLRIGSRPRKKQQPCLIPLEFSIPSLKRSSRSLRFAYLTFIHTTKSKGQPRLHKLHVFIQLKYSDRCEKIETEVRSVTLQKLVCSGLLSCCCLSLCTCTFLLADSPEPSPTVLLVAEQRIHCSRIVKF